MDNAKEELLRCEGIRKLKIEIQHYNGTLYLMIANTYKEKNIDLTTKKKDKKLHGHGIQNMRAVVERYHGIISWEYEEDLFVVKIEI